MAARASRRRVTWRAGDSDPFNSYNLECLYALAMTLNDLEGEYLELRDAEHEQWLRLALIDVLEERIGRLVKTADAREREVRALRRQGGA